MSATAVSGRQYSLWRSRWAALGAAVAVALGGGGLFVAGAASSAPSSVVTIDPVRILDTRTGLGLQGPFVSAVPRTLQVTGADVPTGATGVLMNVTVVGPTAAGFLAIRPGDAAGAPSTSSLNFAAGDIVPNAVQVALPTAGANAGQIAVVYDAYGVAGPTTSVLIDVVGYLVAGTGPAGPAAPAGILNRISDDQIAQLRWYEDPGAAATYPTGDYPKGVAFDGTNIWIANYDSGTVSKMDRFTGARIDYPTGAGPQGVAFDGTNMWITNGDSDTVSKMVPATGTKVDYPTGRRPDGIAFDGTNIWIANTVSGSVSKMDPATGARVDYPVPDMPYGIAFDGTSIWTANAGFHTVSKIDPATGTTVDYPTGWGTSPSGVAFDGTSIWIANTGSATVSKMNPATGTRLDYPTEPSPRGVVFDGTNIWVTHPLSDTVSKVLP